VWGGDVGGVHGKAGKEGPGKGLALPILLSERARRRPCVPTAVDTVPENVSDL